jgi:glutamate-1-semialdehyde 2,1-aminomutase
VLGAYHPCVLDNVPPAWLSGLDEVSFHMSGTEAVMQAVRLARYHTGRSHLVRFAAPTTAGGRTCSPGRATRCRRARPTRCKEMDESLKVLRTRKDIACVLVNPLQALHPNAGNAPVTRRWSTAAGGPASTARRTRAWLQQLREVCTERGIVLIFDEIFVGFRLAPAARRSTSACRPTWSPTARPGRRACRSAWSAGGRPDEALARRSAGRHLLCARHLQCPSVRDGGDEGLPRPPRAARGQGAVRRPGRALGRARRALQPGAARAAGLPVRVANLSSIWTVLYTRPSRYNWMLQFYLRAHGLALSWVGSGRLIFSLNYSDADFDDVLQRFVAAGAQMRGRLVVDGPALSNRSIRRGILLREMLRRRF